jgi:hypothetical protein
MLNLKNILNGWGNFIEKSEVTEALAETRAAHCVKCPELKEGKLLALIKDDLKEVAGQYCALCYCPASAKIRSENETCPLSKW